MTDLTRVCITSTAETALKKLKKAEIGVYDCKKDGTRFIFSVKDKQVKKVFAIFSKPCYNVTAVGLSKRAKLMKRFLARIGLIIGAVVFAALAALSNCFIFKITVSGSGSYLSPEVKRIIYETGVSEFKLYKNFDAPAATGKILALPQVTFCNIQKRGSVLVVDVQVDEEHFASTVKEPLVADADGVVRSIVAICGTARVSVGDSVVKGDTLIDPYSCVGDKITESLAAGYVELECKSSAEYFAEEESDDSLREAYASLLLSTEDILTRSHTVKETDGGVIYVIEFTWLHKLSINIGNG